MQSCCGGVGRIYLHESSRPKAHSPGHTVTAEAGYGRGAARPVGGLSVISASGRFEWKKLVVKIYVAAATSSGSSRCEREFHGCVRGPASPLALPLVGESHWGRLRAIGGEA